MERHGATGHEDERLRAALRGLAADHDDDGALETVIAKGRSLRRRRRTTRVGMAVLVVVFIGAATFGVVRLAQDLGDDAGAGGWTDMGAPAAGGTTDTTASPAPTTTAQATSTTIGDTTTSGVEATYPPPDPELTVVFEDHDYGFSFYLPESWRGFEAVVTLWEGRMLDTGDEGAAVTGPEIVIRHPLWTQSDPRQDIPIMVFTLEQWSLVQAEKLGIGAAPIPPSELGRNDTYVFALPARYNYAFPTGWEEVERILQEHPLQPLP